MKLTKNVRVQTRSAPDTDYWLYLLDIDYCVGQLGGWFENVTAHIQKSWTIQSIVVPGVHGDVLAMPCDRFADILSRTEAARWGHPLPEGVGQMLVYPTSCTRGASFVKDTGWGEPRKSFSRRYAGLLLQCLDTAHHFAMLTDDEREVYGLFVRVPNAYMDELRERYLVGWHRRYATPESRRGAFVQPDTLDAFAALQLQQKYSMPLCMRCTDTVFDESQPNPKQWIHLSDTVTETIKSR